MPRGGPRVGSGRPPGSRGKKSADLAGRLDALNCDPAEGLARIAARAEATGDLDLACRAYATLMPFRWAKLKETSLDVGLDTSLAGRLEAARARIHLEVVTGIGRPPDASTVPDDARKPVAPILSTPPPLPPEPLADKPHPAVRPTTASSPPSHEQPMPSHVYWTRQPEPEPQQTDYDPWEKD
jgi:hypothetical protein